MKTIVVKLKDLKLSPEEKKEVEVFKMAEESAKNRIEIAGVHGTPYSTGNKNRVPKGNKNWSDKNKHLYDKEKVKVMWKRGCSPKEKVIKAVNIGDIIFVKDKTTGEVFPAMAEKFNENRLSVLVKSGLNGVKTRSFGYDKILTKEQATSGQYKVRLDLA